MQKVVRSLQHVHWRLFAALLVMGLCPTVYTTVRTYFLGQLPGEWAYSIAGQLSWVNLLYEIINEAIMHADKKTPKHFFRMLVGQRYDDEDMIILREEDFL